MIARRRSLETETLQSKMKFDALKDWWLLASEYSICSYSYWVTCSNIQAIIQLLRIAVPKDATPSNYTEETFANSQKTAKSLQKFSPSNVSRHTVCKEMILYATYTYIGKFVNWKHNNACQLPMIVWSQVEMMLVCSQIHHLWYMLECLKLCPIMLLVYSYYAHAVS